MKKVNDGSNEKMLGSCSFSLDAIAGSWDLVQKASRVTLLTHYKPDGDGISACAAFDIILRRLGKEVETVYPTTPEFEVARQPENYFVGKHHQTPDLLVAFDTANYDRLYFPNEFKEIPLINIDHHISNTVTGTFNFVCGDTSSVCELFYYLLQAWDPSLVDKAVAEALLFGILYDSRVFHTQATLSGTLRCAADLMDKGADLFMLQTELLSHKDPAIIPLWNMLLGRIQLSDSKKSVWSYVSQDDLKRFGLKLPSLVGFNDFLSSISSVDVTIIFYETEEGATKVSLRSKRYDVNAFAGQFGGGGHKNASGILIDKPLLTVMHEVTAKLP